MPKPNMNKRPNKNLKHKHWNKKKIMNRSKIYYYEEVDEHKSQTMCVHWVNTKQEKNREVKVPLRAFAGEAQTVLLCGETSEHFGGQKMPLCMTEAVWCVWVNILQHNNSKHS